MISDVQAAAGRGQLIQIPIEEVRLHDVDPASGKRVMHVLDRASARFIRATLEGGWPVIQGHYGEMVDIIRKKEVRA